MFKVSEVELLFLFLRVTSHGWKARSQPQQVENLCLGGTVESPPSFPGQLPLIIWFPPKYRSGTWLALQPFRSKCGFSGWHLRVNLRERPLSDVDFSDVAS